MIMIGDTLQIFVSMIIYMAVVIGIGLYFAKRANESSENYFLGGRTLGPLVTAMSAEASDMSGWLLMGLPGVAYWYGLSDAAWTAIGLAAGTYLNWLFIAKRLHNYSVVADNSITLPDFFSNRFKEKNKIIMIISAVFILVFFIVYASSCFVTVGKLFNALFGFKYRYMMILGAVFVLFYTFIGGFLAESASDTMQAFVMIIALVAVLFVGTAAAGGATQVIENAKEIPGFFEFFGIASPAVADGMQEVIKGVPQYNAAGEYGMYTILSTLAWGLGYFGMPQVLLRFMAIRNPDELKISRRIATVWVIISLGAAVAIGIIGKAVFPTVHLTYSDSENIFIVLSTKLLPTFLAGFVLAGILAATISSSDSYLLIAASAFSLFEIIENHKFNKLNESEENRINYNMIFECDLLIIDDLGTEVGNSFTNAELFNIINERMINEKKTIISTNLSLEQLRDTYSDRITSRVLNNFIPLKFYGKDLRFK
jgi:sodium/proline symporter